MIQLIAILCLAVYGALISLLVGLKHDICRTHAGGRFEGGYSLFGLHVRRSSGCHCAFGLHRPSGTCSGRPLRVWVYCCGSVAAGILAADTDNIYRFTSC